MNKEKIKNSSLKNIIGFFGFAMFALAMFGCEPNTDTEIKEIIEIEDPIVNYTYYTLWDFDTLDGWVDGSQNMNGTINYSVNDTVINMFTRANTWDRPKIRTKDRIYKTGKYTWRVFIPEMGVGDMASIGAFLYYNDTHELDFEIGYGTAVVRKNLDTDDDDLIVYMTSQAHPFKSIPRKIKRNQWYTLEIKLIIVDGSYQAVWYINNVEMVRLNLEYGESIPFYIYCSVENLTFLGGHIPKQDNYALFDYVEFTK